MCLAKCLKFPEFEAGCAYELYAYNKKNVYLALRLSTDDGSSSDHHERLGASTVGLQSPQNRLFVPEMANSDGGRKVERDKRALYLEIRQVSSRHSFFTRTDFVH